MAQTRPDRFLGPGHDEFWASCNKQELRLQRCTGCSKVLWPVAKACEYCGGADLAWERMSGAGKIVSWCTFVQDYYKGVMPVPYDTILVELAEGPLFVSNPNGFSTKEIAVDMPVQLAFIDCEDKAGAFKLPVFDKA